MFHFTTELMVPLVAGLALFLFGMKIVEWALYQWTGPALQQLLRRITHTPLRGLLVGTGTTALLQSSSAVTGITISLARSGLISLVSAIAIALGSNIGTCITAFIASFNCSRTSKMMAIGHFIFNIVGVLVILPFFNYFCKLVELTSNNILRQIANAHTLFNIYNVLLFIPFISTFTDLLGGDKFGID